MAKKDLKTDEIPLSPELDFDFDIELDGKFSQESKAKGRSVITNVVTGSVDGAVSALKSPDLYKDVLNRTLPKSYGTIAKGASEVTKGAHELYDQAAKELKPRLNTIVTKLDQLVPENQKTVKGILEKLNELTGGVKQIASLSQEERDEASIANVLGDVFKAQVSQDKAAQMRELVRDNVDKKRHEQITSITLQMQQDVSAIAQYTTNVTQAYQKKALEIQLRSYMAQKEHSAKTLAYMEATSRQLEAIVKNTALPEFLKITNSERFKEHAQTRFLNSLYGEGSMIQKTMARLKKSASEMVDGAGRVLDQASFGLDGAVNLKEMQDQMRESGIEISKAEMAGMTLGAMGVDFAKDKVIDKLKPMVDKNTKVKETLAKGARFVRNPAGYIKEYRESDDWQNKLAQDGLMGKVARVGDILMDHTQDTDLYRSYKSRSGTEELDQPTMGFDNRAHISLVSVIPGHLSLIHREIAMLRTGKTDIPRLTYDYNKEEFVSEKVMQNRLMDKFIDSAKRSSFGYEIKKAEQVLTEGKEVSEKDRLGLQIFLSRLTRIPNLVYTLENIQKTDAYQSMPETVQKLIDDYFSEMEGSEDYQQKANDFEEQFLKARSAMPSLDNNFHEAIAAGYGNILSKTGLIKRSEDGSRFEVNEDAFYDMVEREGVVASDINVKEKIKPINPESLLKRFSNWANKKLNPEQAYNAYRKTTIHDWQYKKGKGKPGMKSGPMAQDVRRNFGEDAAPDGKAIDLQTMNGNFFAAIQFLGDKVESAIENKNSEGKTAGDYLQAIQHNTHRTNLILMRLLKKGPMRPGDDKELEGLENEQHPLAKMLTGAWDKASEFGKNIKDNVLSPAGKAIGDFYNKNKDPAKDKLAELFNKATTMAGNVLDFSSKVVKDHIPAGLGWIKKTAQNTWMNLKKELSEAKDLYLPGGIKPVIRATKLKMGFYLDQETGEPLTTVEQIMKCKNNIVDRAGNIVLDVEEKAKGLYDAHGDEVKSFLGNIVSGAIGLGKYAFDKTIALGKGIKDKTIKSFKDLKDFFKNKEFGKGEGGFSFGLGGNIYAKKTHDVAVDIRDIMLGEKEEVMKRLAKEGKKFKNAKAILTTLFGGGASEAPSAKEGETTQDGTANNDPAPSAAAPDSFSALRNLGSMAAGAIGTAGDMIGGLRDRFSENLGRMRDSLGGIRGDKATQTATGGIDWAGKKGQMYKGKTPEPTGTAGVLGRLKGFAGRIGDRFGGIADIAGTALGAAGDMAGSAMQKLSEFGGDEASRQRDLIDKVHRDQANAEGEEDYSKINKDSGAGKVNKKDRSWNDKNGDGDRDGGVDDRHEKIERLAEARKKKAQEADLSLRYKSSTNVIDKMLSLAGGFLTGLKDKIGGLVDIGASLLSNMPGLGMIGEVVGKGWAAAKSFAVGSGVRAAVMGAAKAGGGLLLKGAVGLGALGAKASMAMGGALLSAVASPIVLGAVALAGLGFGVYKLYQHANRNNASDVERARLRQYGFAYNTVVDRYNHLPYMLEAYLQDGRIEYSQGKPEINMKKVKQDELLGAFKVDPEDKDQVEKFMGWFKERFKPVFLTHLAALYKIDNKLRLDKLNKLTATQMLEYLEAARFEEGPYDYDISPVKGIDSLDVNASEIKESYERLIEKARVDASKEAKKSTLPPKVPEATVTSAAAAAKTAAESGTASKENKVDKASQAMTADRKSLAERQRQRMLTEIGEGDGTKAPDAAVAQEGATRAPGAVAMASGAISEGSGGMQYVKLVKGARLEGLSPSMLKLFLGMAEEYGTKTGKSIPVTDGFRSYQEQAALYARLPKGRAAPPGRSLHEFGIALDIDSNVANELDRLGLLKKYGFTRPIGQEPWHLEPAGVQKSIDLARKDANEREKMVEASIGRGGGGYGTMPNATKYRRNHELAMSLLNAAPMKVADKKQEAASVAADGVLAANDDGPAMSVQETAQAMGHQRRAPSSGKVADAGVSGSKSNQVSTTNTGGRGLTMAEALNDPSLHEDAEGKGDTAANGPLGNKGDGDIKSIIEASAKRVGVDPNIALAFAAVESDMNPNAKAKTSSAAGLFQFVSGTWKEQLKKNGSKYGLAANTSPFNPEASALMGAEYLKANAKTISSVKPNPNAVDLYLTHFLGPGGARTFLSANPNSIAAEVMPEAAAANRSIFYSKNGQPLTIAQVYENLKKKLQTKSSAYGIRLDVGGPGLKPPKDGEGGTGLKQDGAGIGVNLPSAGMEGSTGLPGSSAPAPSVPSPTPSEGTGGFASGGFSGGSKPGGLLFDTRNPATAATEGRSDMGAPNTSSNMAKVEVLMEKSVSVQTESLKVLKSIDEKLNHEALGKLFATAAAAASATAPKEETVKEKDKREMGRTSQARSSSVDMSRKIA